MKHSLLMMLLCVVILFNILDANTQNTFSERLHFDRAANVFTGIEIEEDGFWIKGISTSIDPSYKTGNVIAKFDFDGNVLLTQFLESQSQSFESWSGRLHRLNDSLLYTIGYNISDSFNAFILAYDENGTATVRQEISNPLVTNGSIYPKSSIQIGQGILFCANLGGGVNSSTYSNIVYLDQDFQPIWEQLYDPYTSESEEVRSLSLIDSTHFLLGGWTHNYNLTDNNFTLRTSIRRMDSEGNTDWLWRSSPDHLERGASSILVTDDNQIVIASAFGIEDPANPISSDVLWDCYVYQIDMDGNIVWTTPLRIDFPSELNRLTKIIKCSDGSGYIVVGKQHISYDVEGPATENNTFDVGGFIGKVSLTGDSLWTRSIIHPDLPSFVDFHEIWDVEEAPDGGYICVGESSDYLQQDRPQRGWVLKVDEYGCLVPNCQLISSNTTPSPTEAFALSLFPNPASDLLHIFASGRPEYSEAEVTIVSSTGAILEQFSLAATEATYIIDVAAWPAGMYVTKVLDQYGKAIDSKPFIKVSP